MAVNTLKSGTLNVRELQEFLGHHSLEMTETYLQIGSDDAIDAYKERGGPPEARALAYLDRPWKLGLNPRISVMYALVINKHNPFSQIDMKADSFVDAIENKERNQNGGGINDEFEVNYGDWEGETAYKWFRYSPLDECPRCGEYKLGYYTFEQGGFLGNKYLRGCHCRNCEYTDEVIKDPCKKLSPRSDF